MKLSRPDSLSTPLTNGAGSSLPSWISRELVAKTIRTWEPFYEKSLTETDAVEILVAVGLVIDATREDLP